MTQQDSGVITMSGVVKTFGSTRALDGVNLQVARGEVHGFLGPNGAGKSTTMRVLLGLLRADGGTISLLGGDPWRDAVALHRRLAYVPGDVDLWPNMTGGQAIDLFTGLRGPVDHQRRDELCDRFDLDPTKKARTYSKGNRQKVALIAALTSEVELLLLDEPTAGLDPLMEVVFQQCVAEAKAAGTTVLLSSHILAQVEVLADRISIVRAGQIVESGTLADLRHMTRTTFTVETVRSADHLARLDGVHDMHSVGETVEFAVDGAHIDTAISALAPLGVKSLVAQPPTLEHILMRYYGDDLPNGPSIAADADQR